MKLVNQPKNIIKFVLSDKSRAKRTRAPVKNSALTPKKSPWLWILSGALVGVLISSSIFVKFNTQNSARFKSPVAVDSASKQSNINSKSTVQKAKTNTPVFEFYTVLPKMNETTAQPTKETSTATTSATAPSLPSKYLVQIKAVATADEADALKATLTLSGFEAKTEAIIHNNTTWYRVVLGPFDSETQAKTQQNLLVNQNIHGSLIKKIP